MRTLVRRSWCGHYFLVDLNILMINPIRALKKNISRKLKIVTIGRFTSICLFINVLFNKKYSSVAIINIPILLQPKGIKLVNDVLFQLRVCLRRLEFLCFYCLVIFLSTFLHAFLHKHLKNFQRLTVKYKNEIVFDKAWFSCY